jgi:hypothetical protein
MAHARLSRLARGFNLASHCTMPESEIPASEPQPTPSKKNGSVDVCGRMQKREIRFGRRTSEPDPTRYGDWKRTVAASL